MLFALTDITNKSLRAVMTGLLDTPYSMNQAGYDLARLRHNGLITRVPHHHRYTPTPEGTQFAIFYTKVHNWVLTPLLATHSQPHAPPELRTALRTIDQAISQRLAHARLRTPTSTLVPRVCLPVSLTRPGPSGSTGPTRLLTAAPILTTASWIRLPLASPHRYDGTAAKDSHLRSDNQRLTAHHR
jgi:hypothetical protein